jgi:uncharacterized membrane protein
MKSIAELKKMVIEVSDLSEIMNYFFDLVDAKVISSSGSYLTDKQIKNNRDIKVVIFSVEKTLSAFLEQKTRISKPILTYLPHDKLYHGLFMMRDGTFTPVIYFSDIKIGVFCITLGSSTEFFRCGFVEASTVTPPH